MTSVTDEQEKAGVPRNADRPRPGARLVTPPEPSAPSFCEGDLGAPWRHLTPCRPAQQFGAPGATAPAAGQGRVAARHSTQPQGQRRPGPAVSSDKFSHVLAATAHVHSCIDSF